MSEAEVVKNGAVEKTKTPEELVDPRIQALVNERLSATVKEIFAGLGPILQSIALTPEKIAEAEKLRRAPDPELVARNERERRLAHQQIEEARRHNEERQASCTHLDANGHTACSLIHNYPDRQPRIVCPICHSLMNPREWRIDAPDAENPHGKAVLVAEHPMYRQMLALVLSKQGIGRL